MNCCPLHHQVADHSPPGDLHGQVGFPVDQSDAEDSPVARLAPPMVDFRVVLDSEHQLQILHGYRVSPAVLSDRRPGSTTLDKLL